MSDQPIRLCEIEDHPLRNDDVFAALGDDASGGVVVFVGNVRDHDGGEQVSHLEYSAHPTALEKMRDVLAEVAAEFDVNAVAAVHRVGRLEIGDAAVVVGAACAHRGAAFDAAEALIDRLKERVPIWKHQVFADGRDEWVGTP